MSLTNVMILVGLILNIAAIVFAFGKGSQRLDDHDRALAESKEDRIALSARLDDAHERLNEHNLRVDRLEQWKLGFTAAANLSGGEKIQV
jgi:hypothetical protein